MKDYTVYRLGECPCCHDKQKKIFVDTVYAMSTEDAIEIALENWSYSMFGQGGSLRERDILTEEQFLKADFVAEIEN